MANPKDVIEATGAEKAPFFMPEKRAKLDAAILGRPEKIQKLIINRALDKDDAIPEVPSAQMWKNFTDEEKDSFIDAVEKQGMKWTAYERMMKSHWPVQIKPKARMNK